MTGTCEQAKIQGLQALLVLLKPRRTCLLLILGKDSILFAVKKENNLDAIPSCLVLPVKKL